jgi:hypothetical protein
MGQGYEFGSLRRQGESGEWHIKCFEQASSLSGGLSVAFALFVPTVRNCVLVSATKARFTDE